MGIKSQRVSDTHTCISCANQTDRHEAQKRSHLKRNTNTCLPLDSCLSGGRAASPHRHVVGVHVVQRVHMAADVEQVTLHRTRVLTRELAALVLDSTGVPRRRSLHLAFVPQRLHAPPSPR